MIVADGAACGLPDVFLGVQFWSSHGEVDDLQAWIGFQNIANGLSPMPGRAVLEEQHGNTGQGIQDLF